MSSPATFKPTEKIDPSTVVDTDNRKPTQPGKPMRNGTTAMKRVQKINDNLDRVVAYRDGDEYVVYSLQNGGYVTTVTFLPPKVTYRQVVGAYYTKVTETHPFASVTRTTFEIPNGQTVVVDVPNDGRDGSVMLSEGRLGLLSFDHPNPMGAAVTLVQTIEKALAGTAGA